MNPKLIEEIKTIFCEWGPLAAANIVIPDLDNYDTEAVDFLFYATKKLPANKLEKLAVELIEEAFEMRVDMKLVGKLGDKLYKAIHKY